MADEHENIERITPYYGKETPIPPKTGAGDRKIEVELKPTEPDDDTYQPAPPPYTTIPQYPGQERYSVILNIETTGLYPWEHRITDICARLPGDPSVPLLHFSGEDEETLVREFINWYDAQGINEVIGYNVAFDLRFIFAQALRYRIQWPRLANTEIYDLQNTMEQIYSRFVYGNNRPGTLGQWAAYLWGAVEPYTQDEMIKAGLEGDYEKVKEYNEYKVRAIFDLLALVEHTLSSPETL